MTTHALEGRAILVVEDNYDLATFLQADLQLAGAEVVGPAGDVRDALELLGGVSRLDGAILDVMLQEERVYGVADVLKARGVPFVFMTGLGREAIPAAYVDVPVLHKPVETEKIASILFAD